MNRYHLQTERRTSLFWLEGRAKEHALKAYDSLDKHTPRRHPKLIIGYRLASRVLSVCRVVVLRDRFATDGRSCRPLRGGSRRRAMRSDAFPFLTVSIIPKATAFRERLWASVVAGGAPRFLCARARHISIVAIPHIRFHMCRQLRFALTRDHEHSARCQTTLRVLGAVSRRNGS
jgi:hypothetical protein